MINAFTRYHYTILIQGRLDSCWAEWFDGMTLSYSGQDETHLSGWVRDQAALFGVLARIRDLGLPLLSIQMDKEINSIS